MKRTICLIGVLFAGLATAAAESPRLIRPGDILIVKVLQKGSAEPLVRETLVVKTNGNLTPPSIPFKVAPIGYDVGVEGLTESQAAYRLRMMYAREAGFPYRVTISRVRFY